MVKVVINLKTGQEGVFLKVKLKNRSGPAFNLCFALKKAREKFGNTKKMLYFYIC